MSLSRRTGFCLDTNRIGKSRWDSTRLAVLNTSLFTMSRICSIILYFLAYLFLKSPLQSWLFYAIRNTSIRSIRLLCFPESLMNSTLLFADWSFFSIDPMQFRWIRFYQHFVQIIYIALVIEFTFEIFGALCFPTSTRTILLITKIESREYKTTFLYYSCGGHLYYIVKAKAKTKMRTIAASKKLRWWWQLWHTWPRKTLKIFRLALQRSRWRFWSSH